MHFFGKKRKERRDALQIEERDQEMGKKEGPRGERRLILVPATGRVEDPFSASSCVRS